MKIEMGKKYRNVEGKEVRLLCVDRPNDIYPVVYLTGEAMNVCTREGKRHTFDETPILVEVSDYDHIKIDDKVVVSHGPKDRGGYWGHFAGVNDEGKPTTWINGATSFSAFTPHSKTVWDNCELYEGDGYE